MSIPNIKLTNKTTYSIDRKVFIELLERISEYERELEFKEIGICLVGDQEIKDLNRRFFGRNEVTDILTFKSDYPTLQYLGEMIINIESIMKEETSDNIDELKKIFIHGLLHLLGHDHINTEARKKMVEKEFFLHKKIVLR